MFNHRGRDFKRRRISSEPPALQIDYKLIASGFRLRAFSKRKRVASEILRMRNYLKKFPLTLLLT